MTIQIEKTKNTLQTLTEFIAGFGIEYPYLYADGSSAEPVDPDTDWAVFSARDSFMAWEMLRCLMPHIVAIRSSVWLNDDGDIIVPLGIAEIKAASTALGNFWRDFERRTSEVRTHHQDKNTPAGRIARGIYRETIEKFLWHWEGTDADFREPSWPTRWTHEFPRALDELLGTLDREAAMLASVAGTAQTDRHGREALAGLSLQEHMAKYDLHLRWLEYPSPIACRLRTQDIYTAAYLAWALDRIEEPDAQDPPGDRECLAHVLSASEAVYAALNADRITWDIPSRMSNVLSAFHHDVTLPTLRASGTSVAIYLLADAARTRPSMSGMSATFIRDVVVRTLGHPTQDLPDYGDVSEHYERFASRLRALQALAREVAGDMRLFAGEGSEGAETSSAKF